jgi:DNA-binding MarR family transcriptional regulator
VEPAETVCVCTALRMATRSVDRLYERAFSEAELTVTSYSILSRLEKDGPLSISQLALRMAVDRTTCTREVAPMVTSGLLDMTIGDDRRRRVLRLTALGEQRLKEGRSPWARVQEMVADEFGAPAVVDLISSLRRLLESSERLNAM